MALSVGELVAKITAKDQGFRKALASAKKSLDTFRSDIDKSSRDVEALGKALTALAGIPALSIVAGAAITASGALLALPAAGASVAAAMVAAKVGTAGMSDALSALASGDAEKAAEALDKLSPSARATALAMDGVRKNFKGVQQAVQEKLFAGLAAQTTALASNYLPRLKTGLGGVATSLNGMAKQAVATASTPFFSGVVDQALASTQVSMSNLIPAVSGLMLAIGALIKAGLPLFEQFTAWLGPALQAKGAFLASAEGAAWLQAKIDAAMPALELLGVILGNTWTVLTTLAGALQGVAAWFQTLDPATQAIVGKFLTWGLVIGVVMMKLAPLVVAIARIGPALIKAGVWIATNIAKLTMWGAAHTVTAAKVVAGWVRMAAAATVNGARMAAAWLLSTGTAAAKATASMVATSAKFVARWTMMAVQAMARAAMMAAAWIVAMGPIGWVIAAIVGLVVLVIANWDKVKSFTISAWNAVVGFVTGAASGIVSAVTGGVSAAYNAVVSWLGRAVSFVASIPGKIVSALGNLGSLLVGAGRSLIMGFWNGIKAAFDWVKGQVSGLLGSLRNLLPFSPAKEGPFSGMGYTTYSGKALMRDFAKGILSQEGMVTGALDRAMGAAQARTATALDVRGRMAGAPGNDLARAVGDAVHDALDGARMEVDGRGVARLVNRQNMLGRRRGSLAPAI